MATQLIATDENASVVEVASESNDADEIKEVNTKHQIDTIPSSSNLKKDVILVAENGPSVMEKLECDPLDNQQNKKVSNIKTKTVRDPEGKLERGNSSSSKRKRKLSRTSSSSEEDEPLLLRRKREKQIWNERCYKEKKQRRFDSRVKKCQLILHRLKVPDTVTHGALLKRHHSRNSQNPYMVKTWLRPVVKIKLVKENDLTLKDSLENVDDMKKTEKTTISSKLSSLLHRNESPKSSKPSSEKTSNETLPFAVKKEKGNLT